MKRLVSLVALVFLTGFVGAHDGSHSEFPEPGTTPASPLFGLEQAQESISLALTFNNERKAQKRIQFAKERLSEASHLTDNNDSANAEKAIKMHTEAMERAGQAIQNLPEEKRENVNQNLNATRNQSISVLSELRQRLPESAIQGIETAIEAQRQRGINGPPGRNPGSNNTEDENQPGQNESGNQPSNPTAGDRNERTSSGGYTATSRVVDSS